MILQMCYNVLYHHENSYLQEYQKGKKVYFTFFKIVDMLKNKTIAGAGVLNVWIIVDCRIKVRFLIQIFYLSGRKFTQIDKIFGMKYAWIFNLFTLIDTGCAKCDEVKHRSHSRSHPVSGTIFQFFGVEVGGGMGYYFENFNNSFCKWSPFAVNRYFWLGLVGLSGIVSSMKSCSIAGLR